MINYLVILIELDGQDFPHDSVWVEAWNSAEQENQSVCHRSFSAICKLHQPQTSRIQLVCPEPQLLLMRQKCGESLIMIDKPIVRNLTLVFYLICKPIDLNDNLNSSKNDNTNAGSPTANTSSRYASSVMAGYFLCIKTARDEYQQRRGLDIKGFSDALLFYDKWQHGSKPKDLTMNTFESYRRTS